MKKAILAVVAIALMVLLVVTMGRRDAPPAGDTAPRTGDTGTSIQGTLTADSPDAPSRSGESPAADPGQAQPPAQSIPAPKLIHRSGTVLHADSLPAEGLVYWIWSDVLPAWAELHAGILELTWTPRLLEPSGITDRRGTWAVATDLVEPRAITFAVDGGLWSPSS